MNSTVLSSLLVWMLVLVVVIAIGPPAVAGPPAPPEVSTFAPAKDLVGQVEYYIERLDDSVKSKAEYDDSQSKIAKDSNTLTVIALALGLHDADNQYKKAAPAMLKAAQKLAAAKDYASAKAGVDALKHSAKSTASGTDKLKWEKVASLDELMEQVPLVNTKLKRYIKGRRFKTKAKDSAGYSAVLAVIAQGSMADTHEANSAGEVEKWYEYCAQMRDAAAAVNAGIHAADQDATKAAMEKLGQSCEDCHAVFHPEDK